MHSTPKRNRLEFGDGDVNGTPNNRVLKATSFNVDRGTPGSDKLFSPGEARRGRPRADLLNTLILEGSTSPSSIKCNYCHRVFPREKSLQAHLRTHTGEKPYICDYPKCTRKFAQSGQLKTHQRLHTGEKPFVCASPNCLKRFTHANRHCPDHPDITLKRYVSKPQLNLDNTFDDTYSAEVRRWLYNFDRRNKSEKSNENLDTTPKKSSNNFKREESVFSSGSSAYYSSCSPKSDLVNLDLEDLETSICSNTSGISETDVIIESPPSKPAELPIKKRWLKEAQEQKLWDSANDLASPINWGEDQYAETLTEPEQVDEATKNVTPDTVNSNQNRPSVLVCVQGGQSKEISNDEIQGAMALVELKNGLTTNTFNYRI